MPINEYKAAVIGAGFGGIAAAIRLQARGIQTTLIEKRERPGGRAYVYEDQGFTFDAGPTVITAPHCLSELFDLAHKSMDDYVDFVSVDPFYRLCWEDGSRFDYSNDETFLLNQIAKFNTKDVAGYSKFFEYSKEVFDQGYTELVHVPFESFWDMVKVSPQLIKLQAYRSVYSIVSKFIQNEKLRQAFSFHSLLIGGNPFTASSIYTLIHALERKWGVYFPRGGTGALVRALVKLFEDIGGTVLLNTEVSKIQTNESGVCGVELGESGPQPYDFVVCNSDVTHTYQKLLHHEPRCQKKSQKLDRVRYSNSLFVVYFGTSKRYSDLVHHSILFGNRYKGLLNDIFETGNLAEDFSLYLHAPCRSDSSLAPEGCDAFYALSPVPHMGKFKGDWRVVGEQYADRILAYLEKHYMPELKKHLVTKKIFTPLDFSVELNAHLGTAFSLEPTLLQSAYFRIHNRDENLPGLYFVGAGTHPGAGVPGVINSAKATTGIILRDLQPKTSTQWERTNVPVTS